MRHTHMYRNQMIQVDPPRAVPTQNSSQGGELGIPPVLTVLKIAVAVLGRFAGSAAGRRPGRSVQGPAG